MSARGVARPQQLIESLQALCAEWLAPHLARLRSRSVVPREKVFNDGLWRTIRLYSWEVAVLDTYLVQRLREIRQLGVIHWVYPTAAHTRFEHSLGVVRQMQALIDGIERNSATADAPLIDERLRYLLRLAALLHDCGHTIMSHVSEPFVVKFPQMRELIDWTEAEYLTWKKPSASEAIAAVFVTSPAFADLIRQPAVGADFVSDADRDCRTLAELIVGGRLSRGPAWAVFLLNGAFDADKLDYMPRDCMMAGVPCSVDIDRVIEKVHIVRVRRSLLRRAVPAYMEWLEKLPHPVEQQVAVLALSGSGALIREFVEMRAVLFDKVYHHQKVRAIELMARRLFAQLRYKHVRDWLELTDSALLHVRNKTARSFRDRYFLKRAFDTRLDINVGSPQTRSRAARARAGTKWWWRLRQEAGGTLQKNIETVALASADILKDRCSGAKAAIRDLGIEIDILDESRLSLDGFAFSGESEADLKVHMALSRGGARHSRIRSFKIRVYAAEPAAVPVMLATRAVLERDFPQMQQAAAPQWSRDTPELVDHHEQLERALYEKHDVRISRSLKPKRESVRHERVSLEKFLKAAWSRIEERAVEFGRYQSANTKAVSPAAIAAFLRQFGSERLARPALRLLESIELKDRTFFVARLTDELRNVSRYASRIAYVCPLGATGDSSALVSYFMNDVVDCSRPDVVPLELALEKSGPSDHIVLWDDFCATGRHSMNVFSQWFGWKSTTKKVLVRPLEKSVQKLLKSRQITICYGMALEDGPVHVQRYLLRRQLENVNVMVPTRQEPSIDTLPFQDERIGDRRERQHLRDFLRDKAYQIYLHKRPNASDSERRKLLLGYGNRAHRIVFYYNVPKVTITCLWEEDDPIWRPLFRRRSKPSLEVGAL